MGYISGESDQLLRSRWSVVRDLPCLLGCEKGLSGLLESHDSFLIFEDIASNCAKGGLLKSLERGCSWY